MTSSYETILSCAITILSKSLFYSNTPFTARPAWHRGRRPAVGRSRQLEHSPPSHRLGSGLCRFTTEIFINAFIFIRAWQILKQKLDQVNHLSPVFPSICSHVTAAGFLEAELCCCYCSDEHVTRRFAMNEIKCPPCALSLLPANPKTSAQLQSFGPELF
jgi:hypothetical protein